MTDSIDLDNTLDAPSLPYRIKLRPTHDGQPLKPGAAAIDGTVMRLRPLWKMGDDDRYPGELALGREDGGAFAQGIYWIASGDAELAVEKANVRTDRSAGD